MLEVNGHQFKVELDRVFLWLPLKRFPSPAGRQQKKNSQAQNWILRVGELQRGLKSKPWQAWSREIRYCQGRDLRYETGASRFMRLRSLKLQISLSPLDMQKSPSLLMLMPLACRQSRGLCLARHYAVPDRMHPSFPTWPPTEGVKCGLSQKRNTHHRSISF